MSVRTLLVVMLALVFGVSSAGMVNMALGKRTTGARVEAVPVVVASVDIPRGGMITSDQITTREFPKDMAPTGALLKPDEAIDRAVLTPLVKGEPVLDGKLAQKGSGRGLAAMVPPGMRAFTIQTPNVASGVAGFILPGNKVDVLLTVTDTSTVGITGGPGALTGGGSTTTLLQNVEILAVDQKVDAPAENKVDPTQLRSVTLLVTPDQASKLDLGQNKGTLHLSLRSPMDQKAAVTRPTTLADLRFYQERPWDERAKGVLEALGRVLAQRREAPAAPPAKPASEPPLRIRTLRGQAEGVVLVVQPPSRTTGSGRAGAAIPGGN